MNILPRFGLFAGSLVAALAIAGAASAQTRLAVPRPPVTPRTMDGTSLSTNVQHDLYMTGTVTGTAGNGPSTLKLDVAGLPMSLTLNDQTAVEVGAHVADASFLLKGATVKVWFHVTAAGASVADLIVVAPTTVKGTLLSDQPINPADPAEGDLLQVQVGSGANAQTVNIAVVAGTLVKVLPPWNASAGLAAATEVAAVGVTANDGTLVAAVVVGLVPDASNGGSGGSGG